MFDDIIYVISNLIETITSKFNKNKSLAESTDAPKPKKAFGCFIPVIVIAVVIVIFNCSYMLNENEDAVITTFGKPSVVENSGLHFKLPVIQKLNKVNMSVRGMEIGYDEYGNTIENESLMITKDFNFVNVDFFIEWQITDAVTALYAAEEPVVVLKTLALSYIRDTIGSYGVDEVLTTGKSDIQTEIKNKLIERLEYEGLGITVRSVSVQDAEPPTAEVSNAFKAVEDAKQNALTRVNQANAYRNQQIPKAEGEAKTIVEKAEGEKQARIKEAEGQIARFNAMYEEYIKFPAITKVRMYYETMEELLPNLKIIIQDDSGKVVNVLGGEAK